ncbi:MAG TPA: hypothetical protein VFZ53_09350 [Polyangiaceae bacterium]
MKTILKFLMVAGLTFASKGAWALEQSGFFELSTPFPSGTGNPNFSFNSAGATPSWVRPSTGIYDVLFPNMANPNVAVGSGGDVQVTAHEPFKHCHPIFWNNSGANLLVRIGCFDRFGNPSNTKFVTAFRRMVAPVDQPSGYARAYLWSSSEAPPMAAPNPYTFNSLGGTNTVEFLGTGLYRARLPGMFGSFTGGTVMVSAYGDSAGMKYCKVGSWFLTPGTTNDLEVHVRCFAANGSPANSRFTLSFGNNSFNKVGSAAFAWGDQPLAGTYTPHTFYQRVILSASSDTSNYSTTALGSNITIDRIGFASYRVNVPSLNSLAKTNVLVTSYGFDDANFCWITSWAPFGSTQRLNLACGTPSGSDAPSLFVAQFGTTQSFIF